MFRTFARVPDVGARKLFLFHPMDLTSVLELAWDRRGDAPALTLGHPLHRSDLARFEDTWFGSRALSGPAPTPPRPELPNLNFLLDIINGGGEGREVHVLWDHLIYAYMIENTRILEIFRRVVHEFAQGERLGHAERRDAALAEEHRGAVLSRRAVVLRLGAAQRRPPRQRGDAARRVSAPARHGSESRHGGQQAVSIRPRRGRQQGVRQHVRRAAARGVDRHHQRVEHQRHQGRPTTRSCTELRRSCRRCCWRAG